MNLVAYDVLNSPIDKSKTWIDFANKRLMSREIAHRKYVTFGKRFDPNEGKSIYFIIILDDPPTDRTYNRLIFDGYGRAKIGVKIIWNEIGFNRLTHDINIPIKHTTKSDDGDIYEIDF